MSRRLARIVVALAAWVASCGSTLDEGGFGTFRFIGRVRGRVPLAVSPPISDRAGNLYTLYGAIGLPETAAFVSRAAGGSSEACALTKGDVFGVHGWAGIADDRAWYWSGFALVAVPATGACSAVLDVDPQTNAELQFRAVMPWVRVTSTRHSLVALVQSPTDPAPFSALVDLDRTLLTNVVRLPGDAPVTVLGVGAEADVDDRVTLVARGPRMEALFFDEDANLTATVAVDGAPPPEYGVVGTLRTAGGGAFVGLTTLGELVVFDRAGGATLAIDPAITPAGVHRWNDTLYLVGTREGRPVAARLDEDGRPGPATFWSASEEAAANLRGAIIVNDDRSYPARTRTWTEVATAVGAFPFLSAAAPWPHARGTTLWIVAGPVSEEGARPITSIAIAPVGIAYP